MDEVDRNHPEVPFGEPDEQGIRHLIGEAHPRARLTDAQVELIRELYDAGQEGTGPKIGYRALAKQFNTSKRTVRDIVNYRRRNVWADSWAVPRRKRRRKRRVGQAGDVA